MNAGTLTLSCLSVAKTASQGRWRSCVLLISLSTDIEGLDVTLSAVLLTARSFSSNAFHLKLAEHIRLSKSTHSEEPNSSSYGRCVTPMLRHQCPM